jgi:hypothetical protein
MGVLSRHFAELWPCYASVVSTDGVSCPFHVTPSQPFEER